jgi:hypothetical protein
MRSLASATERFIGTRAETLASEPFCSCQEPWVARRSTCSDGLVAHRREAMASLGLEGHSRALAQPTIVLASAYPAPE